MSRSTYEPAPNSLMISTLLTLQNHWCVNVSRLNPLFSAPPWHLSVITHLNHSPVIMRRSGEAGCETSLDLLLQLQVFHLGSLSCDRFFMGSLNWARSQKVWKIISFHVSHITTYFDSKSVSSCIMGAYMNMHVLAYTRSTTWLWQRWHPAAEKHHADSANCPPYKKHWFKKKGQSLLRAVHTSYWQSS